MPLTYRVQIDPQPSRAALNESHKKTWITGPNQPLKWMNDYGVICAKAQTQLKQSSKSQRHNDSIVSPHSLFQHLSVLFANHVLHIFAFVYVSIFFFANMEKRMRMWGYMRPLASFTSWTYMSKLSGAKAFLIRTMPTVFRHAPDPPKTEKHNQITVSMLYSPKNESWFKTAALSHQKHPMPKQCREEQTYETAHIEGKTNAMLERISA